MLSAVAARKAAKAATRDSVEVSILALNEQAVSASSSTRSSRTPNKRKTSSSSVRLTQTKRRKSTKSKSVISNPSQNEPEVQVIHLDSSEDDLSSESYMSDVSVNERATATSTRGRHWSPSAPIPDSSEDDEQLLERSVKAPPSSLPPQRLTTYIATTDKNFLVLRDDEKSSLGLACGRAVALGLALGESICFLGVYSLLVVHGQVESCGAILSASPKAHRVFAPRSSHLPVFHCGKPPTDLQFSDNRPSLSPRLEILCTNTRAVIIIQELKTNIESLGLVCRTFNGVFRTSSSRSEDLHDLGLHGMSLVIQKSKSLQPFNLLPSWKSALSAFQHPSSSSPSFNDVYLVKGPKKTGKSTFSCTLVNRLLSRYCKVAMLECDVGQSEFTPAGMVALHIIDTPILGPSFSHPTIPYRAHFVGSTSPRSSPSYYLTAIQALMDTYRQDIQTPGLDPPDPPDERVSEHIPLVVNTMGWIKGLGASLLESIEGIIQPTTTFELEAPVQEFENWRGPITSSVATDLPATHRLEPIISTLSYNAADLRSLSILSYFHATFPNVTPENQTYPDLTQVIAQSWDTQLPLCARPPYIVDCAVAFDQIVLVGAGAEDVVPSEIHRVLNGAVVALLTCDEGAFEVPPQDSNTTLPYSQNLPPPSPSTSHCLGLALIRSISPDASQMQLLTPLPPSLLGKCRVIVKGEVELPIWGMLDFRDMERDKGEKVVPYLQWGRSEGIGGEKRRVRRNLMRRGQA